MLWRKTDIKKAVNSYVTLLELSLLRKNFRIANNAGNVFIPTYALLRMKICIIHSRSWVRHILIFLVPILTIWAYSHWIWVIWDLSIIFQIFVYLQLRVLFGVNLRAHIVIQTNLTKFELLDVLDKNIYMIQNISWADFLFKSYFYSKFPLTPLRGLEILYVCYASTIYHNYKIIIEKTRFFFHFQSHIKTRTHPY